MKREIKFRAWITRYDEPFMMYLKPSKNLFDFEGGFVYSFSEDGYSGFWSHENYEENTDKIDFEIMQSTGLKENAFEETESNKEIYEGDIIEFINGERLSVEWNDDTCAFQYSDGSPINSGERYSTHKMIVGNIYENAEILK